MPSNSSAVPSVRGAAAVGSAASAPRRGDSPTNWNTIVRQRRIPAAAALGWRSIDLVVDADPVPHNSLAGEVQPRGGSAPRRVSSVAVSPAVVMPWRSLACAAARPALRIFLNAGWARAAMWSVLYCSEGTKRRGGVDPRPNESPLFIPDITVSPVNGSTTTMPTLQVTSDINFLPIPDDVSCTTLPKEAFAWVPHGTIFITGEVMLSTLVL